MVRLYAAIHEDENEDEDEDEDEDGHLVSVHVSGQQVTVPGAGANPGSQLSLRIFI